MFDHANLVSDVLNFLKSGKMDKFKDLRELIEKTSLNNPYDPGKQSNYYLMWLEQCAINFPVLYLASIYLYVYANKRGINTFLFATRDCCHWVKIFKKLFPEANAHYFHCSRNMFELATTKKHNDYNRYVRSIVGKNLDENIFIDVHGTGKRAFAYFEKEFGQVPHCLLLSATCRYYQDFPPISRDYAKKNKLVNLIFDARGTPIEMLNYDIIGTMQNYGSNGPIRDQLEYEMGHLEAYHTCIDHMTSQLSDLTSTIKKYDLDELYQVIKKIYKVIQDNKPALAEYINHPSKHVKSEGDIRSRNLNQIKNKPSPPPLKNKTPKVDRDIRSKTPKFEHKPQTIKTSKTPRAISNKTSRSRDGKTPKARDSPSPKNKKPGIDRLLQKMEKKAIAKLERKALKEKEKAEKRDKKLKERLAKESKKKHKMPKNEKIIIKPTSMSKIHIDTSKNSSRNYDFDHSEDQLSPDDESSPPSTPM